MKEGAHESLIAKKSAVRDSCPTSFNVGTATSASSVVNVSIGSLDDLCLTPLPGFESSQVFQLDHSSQFTSSQQIAADYSDIDNIVPLGKAQFTLFY